METPGVPAPWHVGFYRRAFGIRPGAFVDGGMNLGQTLISVRAVEEKVPYFGFEPNPMCVAYLERLIALNGFDGVTVVPAGLSDVPGLKRLFFPPEDSAHPAATMVRTPRPDASRYVSRVVSICVFDQVVSDLDIGPLGVVKIDVEGHELEALSGMSESIGRYRPLVLAEIMPRIGGATPEETAERGSRLKALIDGWGYGLRRVVPIDGNPKDVTLEEFTAFLGPQFDPSESYDYLLVPEELLSTVETTFSR